MYREYRPEELTYVKTFVIRSEQVDMTRRLRMSELFRLLEDISIAHTEALGCTRRETLDRGLLWIITRQLVEIDEMPVYDDEITIRGWQGEMMHVFFPRFYEIIKEGKVIIRAQALWSLIDEDTREIIMPEDYGIELPGRPGSDDMFLTAIVIPESAGEPVSCTEIVTRFSQMDINGHMNNTSYFNMIDDAIWNNVSSRIPGDAATDTVEAAAVMPVPKTLYINYLSEIKAGVHLTLKEYKDAGATYYEGTGDKQFFRARYEY
jgi:acyl-ACP thioesterase